jgi:hypothetical protein
LKVDSAVQKLKYIVCFQFPKVDISLSEPRLCPESLVIDVRLKTVPPKAAGAVSPSPNRTTAGEIKCDNLTSRTLFCPSEKKPDANPEERLFEEIQLNFLISEIPIFDSNQPTVDYR